MFQLKRLKPKIWHLHFEHPYDLTMHFLRYQEYYESPRFKKLNVQLVDVMDWYSRNIGEGLFTYPNDWAGFNLPGSDIFKLHKQGIEDANRYDRMMLGIAEFIRAKEDNDKFYLIGTSNTDECFKATFNHELAHGMFFAEPEYRKKMISLVDELPTRTKNFIFKKLKECGYAEGFLVDECQAYLGTEVYDTFNTKGVRNHVPKFEKIFRKHAGKLRKKG